MIFSTTLWGYSDVGHMESNIAPSMAGDLYRAGGWQWVLIGAACWGLLLGVLDRWSGRLEPSARTVVVAVAGAARRRRHRARLRARSGDAHPERDRARRLRRGDGAGARARPGWPAMPHARSTSAPTSHATRRRRPSRHVRHRRHRRAGAPDADPPHGRRGGPPGPRWRWLLRRRRDLARACGGSSIIDLAGSNQPIWSEDRRVLTVFNGEIYNYRTLRPFLEKHGHSFRTAGDAETVVHLYEGTATPACTCCAACSPTRSGTRRGGVCSWPATGSASSRSTTRSAARGWCSPRRSRRCSPFPRCRASSTSRRSHCYLTLRYVPGPATILEGGAEASARPSLVWQDGAGDRAALLGRGAGGG